MITPNRARLRFRLGRRFGRRLRSRPASHIRSARAYRTDARRLPAKLAEQRVDTRIVGNQGDRHRLLRELEETRRMIAPLRVDALGHRDDRGAGNIGLPCFVEYPFDDGKVMNAWVWFAT